MAVGENMHQIDRRQTAPSGRVFTQTTKERSPYISQNRNRAVNKSYNFANKNDASILSNEFDVSYIKR